MSAAQSTGPARPWLRRMGPRNPEQSHRAATTLELLFDLSFVVAVSFAAIGLHHGIVEGHAARALGAYLVAFFGIWWAWMNFSWFASAYDTDDGVYRLTVLVQIAGCLVLAAGVPDVFDGHYTIVVLGYVVIRLAGVTQWVRAAVSDPSHRPTTTRYAVGVAGVQIGWVLWLALPDGVGTLVVGLLLGAAEVAVPYWAERHGLTPFHREHIAERYGLFTIIVLGEALVGATAAVQAGISEGGHAPALLTVAGAGLVIAFALWWLYFDTPAHVLLTTLNQSLRWGYGHFVVFGAAAAIGAGFEVVVDYVLAADHGVSARTAGYAMLAPVALFLLAMWFLQVLPRASGRSDALRVALPVAAVLIAAAPLALGPIAAIVAAAVLALGLIAITGTAG